MNPTYAANANYLAHAKEGLNVSFLAAARLQPRESEADNRNTGKYAK